MRRALVHTTLLVTLAAFAAACNARNGNGGGAGKPAVAVDVQKVAAADMTDSIAVVGSLTPKFEALVKSEYQGVVEQVFVAQWVRVRKGEPLAKLDTREAEVVLQKAQAGLDAAKAALLEAEVRDRQAEREAQRTRELKEGGLATQQALDDALSMRDASAAGLAAARGRLRAAEEDLRHAQTRLDKALIRAPMDGVVAERTTSPGDMVGEPGTREGMFRVVDNRVLNLTVTVPSNHLAELTVGQPLEFATDALSGRVFTGKVMYINPTVDEASRSVKVIAEVPNPGDELKGGLVVRGRIVVGLRPGVLQIPRQALLSWDVEKKTAGVFVVQGGAARLREVKTGRALDDHVEIAGGLSGGELLVVRGGFNLKDGDKVQLSGAAE